jgi:two-component system sensor histidine kinase UhpB
MNGTGGQHTSFSFQHYAKSSSQVWLIVSSWLLMTMVFVSLLLFLRLSDNKRAFDDEASHAYNAVYERISVNKTVLESFSSVLRITDNIPAIHQYTSEIRQAFPHVYWLGFHQYVSDNKLKDFEQQGREAGYADFKIKDFSYEDDRVFHKVKKAASYYPTMFGKSRTSDSKIILGLDIFAVPFLKQALLKSIRTGNAAATRPFELVEGGQGYMIFKSLDAYPDFDPDIADDTDRLAVSILVRTDQLLTLANSEAPRTITKLSFQNIAGETITEVLPALNEQHYLIKFGSLKFESEFDHFGKPFQLIIQKDNGFLAWEIVMIILLFVITGVFCWLYLKNNDRHHLSNLNRQLVLDDLADQREGLEKRVLERTNELNKKTAEIRLLSGQLINLQEEDYRHIARELHDEFGQLITAIGINTKLVSNRIVNDPNVDELSAETQQLVDQLHTSMHSLIGRLRPEGLDTFGLKVAIEHSTNLFKLNESGIESQLVIDPDIDYLHETYAITIYRAIQELINNAVKHANPKTITVRVKLVASKVIITVADDGCGMNTNNRPKGYGLIGLEERLLALSGIMDITSSPSSGCSIEIKLPLIKSYKEKGTAGRRSPYGRESFRHAVSRE